MIFLNNTKKIISKTLSRLLWGFDKEKTSELSLSLLYTGKMLCITLLVLLNTTCSIDELLLAGKKRMTGRTNLNLHLLDNRSYFNLISAGTGCGNFMIFWMYTFFHSYYSSIAHMGDNQFTQLYDITKTETLHNNQTTDFFNIKWREM